MTTKLFLAMALFFTSITFDQQIMVTKSGVDTDWIVSISVNNEAFALYAMEQQLN